MAIRDNQTIISNAQSITASAAGTVPFDLQDSLHQIGQSARKLKLMVVVNTTFAGSATSYDIALQDSADNSSYADTALKLSTILKAKMTAGTVIMALDLPETGGIGQLTGQLGAPPPGPSPLRRYINMYYTVTGGACTGKIDAWIMPY